MHGTALSRIPAFPAVVLKVLDLLSDDDVRVAELVELIDSDALFSAQLLRAANSPLYGFRSQIDSVQLAIVALGLSQLQALAASVATADYMKGELKSKELHRCWSHSLATAIISRALARACSLPEQRAYTAGLLHDIGRLGLLVAYPREYAAMLRDADQGPQALLGREIELFSVDHCEAGRFLAGEWGLPEEFLQITGSHHEKPAEDSPGMLMNTYLACQMADSMGFSVVQPPQPPSFDNLCDLLPAPARKRFRSGAHTLKAVIFLTLDAHDFAGPGATEPSLNEVGAQQDHEAEENQAQSAPPADSAPKLAMSASLPSKSTAWKPIVVAATVLAIAAVLIVASHLRSF